MTTPANTPDWTRELALVVEATREMSLQTEPQGMVRTYSQRMRQLRPNDGMVALSRRGVEPPRYRITRSSRWETPIDPWKEADRLPLLQGGLLGELLYGDEPRILDELRVAADDPAAEYLAGYRSAAAIPVYDGGAALNMTVLLRRDPAGFAREAFPDMVLMSNLFGRATQNLVLSAELRAANARADHEMQMIADLQRSLLPGQMPSVPRLDLAVHYQTSRAAGGDYYDFFPLPGPGPEAGTNGGDRWGLLIADVSGHGASAAVLMAITHSIVHVHARRLDSPAAMLAFVNRQLVERYTHAGRFVTAFYGIFDPARRTLTYASAGHHPPLWKRASDGARASIDGARGFPLGLFEEDAFGERTQELSAGDVILFYTDGITEAFDPDGAMFGLDGLDAAFAAGGGEPQDVMNTVLGSLADFTRGRPADDDRTLVVARVR